MRNFQVSEPTCMSRARRIDPSGKVSVVDREKPSGCSPSVNGQASRESCAGAAGDIRFRLVHTFLATNPFGTLALVIMSVAGEAISMRAELDPVLVKATLEAGVRLIISIGVTDPNSAQSMKIMIDKLQNFFMTFARITKQLANFERGETLVQILKTRNGEQVVIAIGWSTWTGERPEESEPVIDDVEGFGFVSEMMLSVRSGLIFFSLAALGLVLPGWLEPE